jgi:hypothetical protein
MVAAFQHMDRFLYQLFDLEARLPRWLRSPFRGAVFIFGLILGWYGKLFLLLVLASLVILAGPSQGLRLLSLFLGIALLAGGGAGIVSGVLEPLGRTGRLGEWFRWALSIFAYLAVISLLLPPVPFALPDPIFFWMAGSLSVLGGLAMVFTDDRGRSRLPPHQFRLVRSLASLRVAPGRIWQVAADRLAQYEARRQALEAELATRPEAREELVQLLQVMRTDVGHVRNGLERFVRLVGSNPDSLEEAEAWLDRIDERLEAVEKGPQPSAFGRGE